MGEGNGGKRVGATAETLKTTKKEGLYKQYDFIVDAGISQAAIIAAIETSLSNESATYYGM